MACLECKLPPALTAFHPPFGVHMPYVRVTYDEEAMEIAQIQVFYYEEVPIFLHELFQPFSRSIVVAEMTRRGQHLLFNAPRYSSIFIFKRIVRYLLNNKEELKLLRESLQEIQGSIPEPDRLYIASTLAFHKQSFEYQLLYQIYLEQPPGEVLPDLRDGLGEELQVSKEALTITEIALTPGKDIFYAVTGYERWEGKRYSTRTFFVQDERLLPYPTLSQVPLINQALSSAMRGERLLLIKFQRWYNWAYDSSHLP